MKFIVFIIFLSILSSCHSHRTGYEDVLSAMVGKEVAFSDSLRITISDRIVNYDLNVADYTIVTYIDSTGCTPCKMKLSSWDVIINELSSSKDVVVNFVMILKSSKTKEIDYNLKKYNFLHPVYYDSTGKFSSSISLPDNESLNTILLDSNNVITLVGNPATNPKIFDLYKKLILSEAEESNMETNPIGAVYLGDTIVRRFELRNIERETLTLQQIVPSCDCMTATMDSDSIPSGQSAIVTTRYIASHTHGYVRSYVDIYFNEKDKPKSFALYGYVIDNQNSNLKTTL